MENQTPTLVLTIMYWLHMTATVVWIGGLASFSLMVLPAAKKALEPASYSRFLRRAFQRLQQVTWLSLVVLTATGMFQMSANPSYNGFFSISSTWAMAILLKHGAVGLMILVAFYSTMVLNPQIERLALIRASQPDAAELQAAGIERRETGLLHLNLGLSLVILLLTALARVS